MTIDLGTVQLFVGGLVFFALLIGVAALLPKSPRKVELTMHVSATPGARSTS